MVENEGGEMVGEEIRLLGKVIITGKIETRTGLSIGGSRAGLEIGGVDNPVIKDVEGKPYIPGSSLKGKMRCLLERAERKELTTSLGKARIHVCEREDDYKKCCVCKIFGLPGEKEFGGPTRLIVRDSFLTDESAKRLRELPTDMEYTEIKFENAIDRITSAANPRQTERVPAGAEFNFEMIYNVFCDDDKNDLRHVFKAMKLLEDDYLGSSGSRGYGKIRFKDIEVFWNPIKSYESGELRKITINGDNKTPEELIQNFDELKGKMGNEV